MKFRLFFLCFFCIQSLFADMILSPDSLPDKVKIFLKTHFKAQVGMVQMDENIYEVYLSDGTELEFYMDGSWKDIETKFQAISPDVFSPNLASIIKNTFPNLMILEIERKINHYKIEFSNGLEVEMDLNGTILHTEYDD